ncbi:HAMP domain-containing protein [Peteryoungia desertarenae]|uniref:HAMP domain-containing protein n=1 Tax=Peteryoungia desertarenae TaxID=1813451 RepID=A0ABX6QMC0_9HYPH|nr:HAMP domain-containing methyl-accepting chemotaxis protein [Peteryoungia desertarenae]QLF69726.1 HAMP domain-containing protein [Peteryoungia desertarenae]
MPFLKNAPIQTKILSVLIPICLVGIGGTLYVAKGFSSADEEYSRFIAEDNVASAEVSRAVTSLVAVGYTTFQSLMYDPFAPEWKRVQHDYTENRDALFERLAKAKALTPEYAADLDRFADDARSIMTIADQAIAASARGDSETASSLAIEITPLIAKWRGEMRTWNDTVVEALMTESAAISKNSSQTIINSIVTLALLFAAGIGLALLISSRGITRPIHSLRARMATLADGDTGTEIFGMDRKDELGEMAKAVAVFRDNALERQRLESETAAARSLSETERLEREKLKAKEAADIEFAVDHLATALGHMSEGNLGHRINESFAGQLDVIRDRFNSSASKLEDALSQVMQNSRAIGAGSQEIRAAADDLAKRTEQQAASVEETAAALEEITTTVKDSTRRAQEAGELVAKAKTGAEKSGEVVRNAVVAMKQIEKSSSEIGNIISVIDEIAFQTNLLALNAGVEAARAGEAGKGFAVVAQEVRELAQRSASAAKDIKALINASNVQVQSGVSLVDQTGTALETIVAEVQEINRHVRAIVEAAQEQSVGLQQINSAVNQMDQDTQKNAAMVEESTAASHSLAKEVTSLNQLLSQFKLSGKQAEQQVRAAQEDSKPVASPARALGRKLASAFGGRTAAAPAPGWDEF